MARLTGKIALITGGAGGIGQAAARRFTAEGAKVVLVDLDESALQSVVQSIGEDMASYAVADVTQPEQVQSYVNAAVERWGGVDIYLANAGIEGTLSSIPEYPIDIFDRVMAVNVRASFLACKYGLAQMNDGGSIIITSSIMGVQANPNIVAYATSKHAVVGLMRTVAKEAAPRNIRVNVIAPGPVDNEFQTDIKDRLGAVVGIDATKMIDQAIPLKRHATADEIAGTVLFLASDQSSFSTGSVFMADGGLNA